MSTQDIVESFIQQCRKEGLDEGLKKGLDEGRHEGLAVALLRLYEARFGTPPAAVATAIHRMRDQATLLERIEIIRTRSADEVVDILRAPAQR